MRCFYLLGVQLSDWFESTVIGEELGDAVSVELHSTYTVVNGNLDSDLFLHLCFWQSVVKGSVSFLMTSHPITP